MKEGPLSASEQQQSVAALECCPTLEDHDCCDRLENFGHRRPNRGSLSSTASLASEPPARPPPAAPVLP
jgi:hypothetical protein